jgi:protein-tyrosine phosphatase
MAQAIDAFVSALRQESLAMAVVVHCECGVSRSAAVALFIAALTGAPLAAREYAYAANPWVVEQLQALHPGLTVDIPLAADAHERRQIRRD